jgi:DNA-binding FrmR family transcriptional regulator
MDYKNPALLIAILDALGITGLGLYLNKEISEVSKEVSQLQTEVNERNEIVKYLKSKEDEFKKLESYIKNNTSIQSMVDRDKQLGDIMTVLSKVFQQMELLNRKVLYLESELVKYKSINSVQKRQIRPPSPPKIEHYEEEEEEEICNEDDDEDVKLFMDSMGR